MGKREIFVKLAKRRQDGFEGCIALPVYANANAKGNKVVNWLIENHSGRKRSIFAGFPRHAFRQYICPSWTSIFGSGFIDAS